MLCSPANPKPQVFLGQLSGKGPIFQRDARGPDFLPVALAEFLELQGWVLRIGFQQRELLVGTSADLAGQSIIIVPEIRVRAVDHDAGGSERLRFSSFVVSQGAVNAVIEAPGVKVGLKLRVDRLRAMLVQPCVQLLHLSRCKGRYRAFNLLDCVRTHRSLFDILA